MDSDRQRIEEDLRGQLAGEVCCDDLHVQLYASDASVYEIRPLGVVRPRHAADVAATVRYAAENELPLHPRGAGTGLAGESLGPGLVVDFSRYMTKVLDAGRPDAVRVQAGVVLDQLNRRLQKQGRLFGPDPANSAVTTMGSVLAIDASGSRRPAYGSARDHVVELDVVLADGREATFTRSIAERRKASWEQAPVEFLARGVADICREHAAAIASAGKLAAPNRSGYRLDGVLIDSQVDLARLLVGSEGTLGLITSAVVTTSPIPAHIGSALLLFDSLDKAAQAAAMLAADRLKPRACDLMDRRHLSLAREQDPRYELMIPQAIEAVLLIEYEGDDEEHLKQLLDETIELLTERRRLAAGAHVAADAHDRLLLSDLARRFTATLYRLRGSTRPIPLIEDVAVPPAALPDFLRRAQMVLNELQVTASLFGHAGHGQLHIRPFLDLANSVDVGKMETLAQRMYEEAWQVGGTISGEHGDGLSRTPFVARQYGELAGAFQQVKQLFDPTGILNPGKKVHPTSSSVTTNLRRFSYPLLDQIDLPAAAGERSSAPTPPAPGKFELQLDWHAEEMAHAARICNGCGVCRTQAESVRMCPIFHLAPREEASPRAKANLARGVLSGALPASSVLEEEFKQIADLCVHCHMCRIECPANVDVPKLMAEAKATYVATNGLKLADWAMTRIDRLCRLASRAPRVANWILSNRAPRWVLEKTLGIAQGRKLPRISHRPFLHGKTARRLRKPQRSAGGKVLLLIDTYANYCDPQLAEAMVRVLEHNGVDVYVPEKQQEAGMPMISQGAVDPARRIAEVNVPLLAEAVRQGYQVVSTEPSAVLTIRREYPHLLAADNDALTAAQETFDACHYLWQSHQQGRLELDFQAVSLEVGYHAPCHLKALEIGTPAVNLLRLVPGIRVREIERGCSGMAGLYGVKRKNYRNSLRAGLPLFNALRHGKFQAGVTDCSTCRLQMIQGSSKPTIHPIKILAYAYGLMPEVRDLLNRPSNELVV